MLLHNSHDVRYRNPLGAIPQGETVTLRFFCDESDKITLRTWFTEEKLFPMEKCGDNLFEVTITLPTSPGLFWYDFIIEKEQDILRYGNAEDLLGGIGTCYINQMHSYQITVYKQDYKTPSFLHKGIIYQIFPDRFHKDNKGQKGRIRRIKKAHPDAVFHENWNDEPSLILDSTNGDNMALDFFGGTLTGITQKLKWLKEMGVSILYINPIFRARSNHRYDTGNYEEIDPILGEDKDFDNLIAKAKKLDIHIILDGVFSHTGADSLYFNKYDRYQSIGAYQSKESAYYGWYHFNQFPDDYNCWWGFNTLPAINKDHPDYRNYLLNKDNGIFPSWIKKGANGWRLDVVDELPMDLVGQMRDSIKKVDSDAVLIGEVWEDASNKVAYGKLRSYCLGDSLDSVMNYPLRRAIIDFFTNVISAEQLSKVILHQQEVYPTPFYYSLMNLLGSHDRVRILHALAGHDTVGIIQMDKEAAREVKLDDKTLAKAKTSYLSAMKLLCALPGAPTLYYGDDIGMTSMSDPWNRAPMAWDNMDNDLHEKVTELLHERNNNPLLQTGYLSLKAVDENTLEILRFTKDNCDVFGETLQSDNQKIIIQR